MGQTSPQGLIAAKAGYAAGSGRGPIAAPARGRGHAPTPVEAWAPGGAIGPVRPAELDDPTWWPTLPLPQPAFYGQDAPPDELRYARPYSPNVAGRDGYTPPTTFNPAANATVGGLHGAVTAAASAIPTNSRRADQMTFYRWARAKSYRYPDAGHGTPRLRPQGQQRSNVRYLTQARMASPHQNALTVVPPASSFGQGTTPLLSAFQESSF